MFLVRFDAHLEELSPSNCPPAPHSLLALRRAQAVSLSALAKADVMQVPKPLHLGVLPK